LNCPVNSKLKLSGSRTKLEKYTVKKHFLLGFALILLSIVPACLLTLLGQNLPATGNNGKAKNTIENFTIDTPVFSPLARSSRSINMQFGPGAHIIYSGDTASTPKISSRAEWWIARNEDSASETVSEPEASSPAFSGKPGYQESHQKTQTNSANSHVVFQESVQTGIVDLMKFLQDKDLKRQAEREQGVSKTNPFEEALKSSREVAAKESASAAQTQANKEPAESKPASDDSAKENKPSETNVQEVADSAEPAASLPLGSGTFLVIGAFNNQVVATDMGTATLNPFNESVTIDLAGAGKTAFDMNIILRNRVNQESVAFGDLNLDGFADMVLTNKSTDRALIYLGDSLGRYKAVSEIRGSGPATALISDFNQDESPDIAVLFQKDKSIVVNGDGYRQFMLPFSLIDDDYSSMVPYDFNGDGLKDLVLVNYSSLTAAIYTNCGKGFFSASGAVPLQSFPLIQSSADLDADGISDLIYVQYLDDRISIVIQNGRDGGIQSLGNMILDPLLYYAVGDFNQDGVIDIAIAHPK
jgi:hypothetical protein